MANVINRRFCTLDTFGSDVTLKTGWANVISITVYADTEIGIAHLNNANGEKVFIAGAPIGNQYTWALPVPVKVFGLVFDDTASSLNAGDFLIVHFG